MRVENICARRDETEIRKMKRSNPMITGFIHVKVQKRIGRVCQTEGNRSDCREDRNKNVEGGKQ